MCDSNSHVAGVGTFQQSSDRQWLYDVNGSMWCVGGKDKVEILHLTGCPTVVVTLKSEDCG